jgi:NAD(P)-dependent dehydrogenase (short-subunit alcohol dehydrogenase family)
VHVRPRRRRRLRRRSYRRPYRHDRRRAAFPSIAATIDGAGRVRYGLARMPTGGLTGRSAVVTGGASGIGRAIARRLAAAGAAVAVLDLDEAGAAAVVAEIEHGGGSAVAVAADVADGASVCAATGAVHAALGPVHVLVNNAGICTFVPFADMREADWDGMMAVTLKGAYYCAKSFVPDMQAAGWGRVVNVSSLAGVKGAPRLAHYAAAKAGLLGFTKALAVELGPEGITVNAIAPGLVDTPLLVKSGMPDSIRQSSLRELPVRRLGVPDDVAAACAYLISPEAGFVTGQVLGANGGAYM